MKIRRVLTGLGALLALAAFLPVRSFSQQAPAGGVHPDVIYGDDDRIDVYAANAKLKAMAASTVGLFQGSGVTLTEDKQSYRLDTQSYGDSYGLCQDEPFRDQRSGAFCSGSLVAPDIIMTAGHCVTSEDNCKNIKFVFGFSISKQGGETPSSVPATEVYGCAQLIGRDQQNSGADWSLIKLDRAVSNHAPLKINRSGPPAKGTPLVVIGHPAGLPTKVAGGATVRESDKGGYFTANLDTYGGNSGSAVFNAVTGQIEGILVRGEQDFTYDSARQCRKSNVCPADGCRGEDVTLVSVPGAKIPNSGPSAALADPGPALRSLQSLAGQSSR